MALHDTHVRRLLAFGVSGLSVTADSLSAIKYAKVTPVRDERGIVIDFKVRLRLLAHARAYGSLSVGGGGSVFRHQGWQGCEGLREQGLTGRV
jgi:hypothetical protein